MLGSSFTFLAVDGTGRPSDPGSRAAIRSRCMKGVNVRPDSRRSKRKSKNTKARFQENLEPDTEDAIIMRHQDSSLYRSSRPQNHNLCGQMLKPLSMRTDDFGFDSSLFPSSIIQTVMRYNSLLNTVYPLEMILDLQNRMTDDFHLLHQNKTVLSAIYLATYAADDLRYSSHLSSWTQQLLCTILSSLNHDLHHDAGQQSSTTVMTILILLFAAEALQDFEAVESHLEGIRKLLMIRDHAPTGLDAKLLFKIQQFDLRLALASGRPLHLALEYNNAPGPPLTLIGRSDVPQRLEVHSPWVIEAFQNMHALTQDIKDAMRTRTDLRWDDFQYQISNIQTQLLHPNNSCLPDIDEAMRLGMLAFLTTLYRSPIRRQQLPEFHRQFEASCIKMRGKSESYRTFNTWVMMMGFISAVEVSSPLAGVHWEAIVDSDLSWQTMRDMITAECLPWIEFIHDEPAKKVFIYLQAQRTS